MDRAKRLIDSNNADNWRMLDALSVRGSPEAESSRQAVDLLPLKHGLDLLRVSPSTISGRELYAAHAPTMAIQPGIAHPHPCALAANPAYLTLTVG